MTLPNQQAETLYYDGQCPLCTAEIRRLSRYSDHGLRLVDVHDASLDENERSERLKVLHLERADGTMLRGLDANLAAWDHTRYGALLGWLKWPVIRHIASFVYHAWAEMRYARMYGQGRQRSPFR